MCSVDIHKCVKTQLCNKQYTADIGKALIQLNYQGVVIYTDLFQTGYFDVCNESDDYLPRT